MKGAKILIESLVKEGVEVIFGYPGGRVLDIYDALYQEKRIRHILVRHEQGAGHAADGYARSTGKVGVCLTTSGPGATNLVTAIATAYMDSVPLVAITGQVSVGQIGKDAFQEADMTGITIPITKHNYLVKDVKNIAATIKEAFWLARSGRPGPVLVDIPSDICTQDTEFKYPDKIDLPNYKPTLKGNPRQIKQAAELLINAKRPLILSGAGIINAGASKELTELVQITKIPITTTLLGLGSIPPADGCFLGMPGMHGTAAANYSICEADVIFAIGMRFDDRITGNPKYFANQAKIIHADIDPAEINKCIPADVPIIGDAREILKELLVLLKKDKFPVHLEWAKQIKQWQKEFPMTYEKNNKIIKPQQVMETLNELTKGNAFYITDVGTHQMFAAQYLQIKSPRHFLSSGGLGTMGFGMPAAMGTAAAHPKDNVICLVGDGGMQMNLQELGTIATNKLPVKTLIINNRWLGMVRQWQQLFYREHYSHTDLEDAQPDFLKLAEAYGIKGVQISDPKNLAKQLKEILEHKGPVLANILVARDENVYPMVPSGGVLGKMLFPAQFANRGAK
ncbi:acetolactate synthase large subunit [Candidatus Termititenax dinenymphae]|uniref:Acetolactate synthase n=1 Tax=Candidatus Termititenax dinenymphae TaxID=2218523 RepID=A0A388TKK0_9BACT|nr:acetolactate synthase large subunit [Candidatus Termititenax dinenymphae]